MLGTDIPSTDLQSCQSVPEVRASPPPPSIADYYHKCINCKNGLCITAEQLTAIKSAADESSKSLQVLLDEVDTVEYSVSTITSAFLQQKRALEKELLSLDLAYSAVIKEQTDNEAMRDDFLQRAQKHVTQRNFLRRFAGQQQIQLVHRFGPRIFNKAARGGGPSDDSLFYPVVLDNNVANGALVGYDATEASSMREGASARAPRLSYPDGQSPTVSKVPLVGIDAPHTDIPYQQGLLRRHSSTASRRSIHDDKSDMGRESVVSLASSSFSKADCKKDKVGCDEPTVREAHESEGDSGLEDIIQQMKNKRRNDRKLRKSRNSKGNAQLIKRASSETTRTEVRATKAVGAITPGGAIRTLSSDETSNGSPMRRLGSTSKTNRKNKQQQDEDSAPLSALDAADRAAEKRSAEVEALIRRLDNSSTEIRAQNVLDWYKEKLADEAEARAKIAAQEEEEKMRKEEEATRQRAEAEVMQRRVQRERLLFTREYAEVQRGEGLEGIDADIAAMKNTAAELGRRYTSITQDEEQQSPGTPLTPCPPPIQASSGPAESAHKSIFANPKYRLAAMKAMVGHAKAIK